MKDSDKMAFANRLLSALERSGMTQKELAKKIGVTETTMSRYVNGVRSPNAAKHLPKLATALGVDSDWLIGKRETEHAYNFDDVIKVLKDAEKNVNTSNEFGRGVSEGILYAIHTMEVMM